MEYDLKWLAIGAALGIDNHILGTATKEDYRHVKKLASYLRKGVRQKSKEGYLHRDISESLIIWEALGKKQRHSKEVALQTSLLAKKLKDINLLSSKDLPELRDICSNLSKKALSYEQNYIRRLAA
ncbi:hypothetical protein GOV13_03715 [Candidatus Pacearchaeota archaeon]|nr:hypothetical protein [Candidatus Pacearchaeota archaeon]